MSLKVRFKFDGRCRLHPRYNPAADGQPQHKDCPGCDSLWVIWLYCKMARRRWDMLEIRLRNLDAAAEPSLDFVQTQYIYDSSGPGRSEEPRNASISLQCGGLRPNSN